MSAIDTTESPNRAHPDAVLEALDALTADSRTAPPQRRRQERAPWNVALTIWVREPEVEFPRELKVRSHDLSRGGFSFLHAQFLHTNTLVCTRFDALPGQPTVAGVVTNCCYLGNGRHRIGVRFVQSEYGGGQEPVQAG